MRFHRKDGQTYLLIWWLKLPYRKWLAKKNPKWAEAILDRRCKSFKRMPPNTASVMFLNSPEKVTAMKERLEAWNKGEPGAFNEPEDPDDVTLAQPRRPTTKSDD
jgi:hypothetical protein